MCQSVCEHMASTGLRGLRAHLLRRREHRPLVACLAGLYGCRWRSSEWSRSRPGDCCCNKVRPTSSAAPGPDASGPDASGPKCSSNLIIQPHQNKSLGETDTKVNMKPDFEKIQCKKLCEFNIFGLLPVKILHYSKKSFSTTQKLHFFPQNGQS